MAVRVGVCIVFGAREQLEKELLLLLVHSTAVVLNLNLQQTILFVFFKLASKLLWIAQVLLFVDNLDLNINATIFFNVFQRLCVNIQHDLLKPLLVHAHLQVILFLQLLLTPHDSL